MRRFIESSLRCSFCNAPEKKVGKLISSPSNYPPVHICDECVAVCAAIIEDDRREEPVPSLGAAQQSAMGVYHPLAPHLIKAVEVWIRRESAGEEAAGELQEVRSIASEMIRE
jgi:hypothetical protein